MLKPISTGLPKHTIIKIFMAYYGSPCLFKDKDSREWRRGFVSAKTLTNFDTTDNILLLQPLYKLTASHIKKIHELMGEDTAELDLSEQGVKEFIEHLQDEINLISFIVADYLRRESFVLPIYNIDLFKTGIAQVFKPMELKSRKESVTNSNT